MIRASRRDNPNQAEAWFGQLGTFVLRLVVSVALVYILWRIRSILTDVVVSAILACALVGPVNILCRIPVPRISSRTRRLIATLIVFILFGFAVYQALDLMLAPFRSEMQRFQHNLPQYKLIAANWISSTKDWYAALPPDVRTFVEKQGAGGFSPSPSVWIRSALEGTVYSLSKIVDVLLIPVLAFYFVLDGHDLRNEFLALLPKRRVREAIALLRESSTIMRTFVTAQIWLCVIAGVVVFIGLSLIHMDYAVILGLLAGITRAIPIIGPVIGGIPIILLAAIKSPLLAVKVLIFFSSLHLIESKLIMPKFIGHRIHLHAAIVIIALLIGGEFFGLLGMFLAAPMAAFGRVLINHYLIRPRLQGQKTAPSLPSDAQPSLIIKAQ